MATNYDFDPDELDKVLAQVEKDLAPVLKSEAQRLAKAKDDEGSGSDEGGSDEGSAPSGGEDSAPAEGSASPDGSAPPAEGSAPPSPAPEGSASPEGSAPPAGPEGSASPGGVPQDPAAIAQMIQGLPPEVLKTVYLAAKQALFAQMSGGAGGAAPGPEASASPAGAPPAGPPAGPGPEASASPAGAPAGGPPIDPGSPAMKGEMSASPGNGGKTAPVKKNEANPEVALLKAELESLKKSQSQQVDLLTRAVQKLAGTPVRKAVTGISHIAKSESEPKSLSKSEVNAKLKEKARTPSLAKKDREAINRFYDTGANDITIVAHLLT